jgi:hypothetical protein
MFRPWSLLLLCLTAPVLAADYPQFRGPHGNGSVEDAELPLSWSESSNLRWKTELPGSGWSQPVVVGQTVFITAAVSDKLPPPKDMAAGAKDLASIPIPGFGPKPPNATLEWQLMAIEGDSGKIRWTKTIVAARPKQPFIRPTLMPPKRPAPTPSVCTSTLARRERWLP